MSQCILAHDLGTTGNKATLYDADGRLVGSAFYSYGTEYAHAGWAEQNPEDWWRAVCASTQQLLREANVSPGAVAGITFSGQMMAAVPLDAHARPLRNAIIWADQRAVEQERWLGEHIPPEDVYRITGHRLSASYSLCKILWLRDNQPDVYAATHKFVHAKDAIVARLTGNFATRADRRLRHEPVRSGRLGLVRADHRRRDRPGQAARATPLDRRDWRRAARWPARSACPPGRRSSLAAATACAAAGAGVVREGAAYNYIGSSSWIALATEKPIYDPDYRTFTWRTWCRHVQPVRTMQMAGGSYQWARDQVFLVEKMAAEAIGTSPYELMNLSAESSPPGANGLIYLPYLLGERSPRWNPDARGAFIGLTVRHTHADMLRAVLEGVTMNLRVILDAYRDQGARIDAMRVIGGGARGRFWNRLMADIYGVPCSGWRFSKKRRRWARRWRAAWASDCTKTSA